MAVEVMSTCWNGMDLFNRVTLMTELKSTLTSIATKYTLTKFRGLRNKSHLDSITQ